MLVFFDSPEFCRELAKETYALDKLMQLENICAENRRIFIEYATENSIGKYETLYGGVRILCVGINIVKTGQKGIHSKLMHDLINNINDKLTTAYKCRCDYAWALTQNYDSGNINARLFIFSNNKLTPAYSDVMHIADDFIVFNELDATLSVSFQPAANDHSWLDIPHNNHSDYYLLSCGSAIDKDEKPADDQKK